MPVKTIFFRVRTPHSLAEVVGADDDANAPIGKLDVHRSAREPEQQQNAANHKDNNALRLRSAASVAPPGCARFEQIERHSAVGAVIRGLSWVGYPTCAARRLEAHGVSDEAFPGSSSSDTTS